MRRFDWVLLTDVDGTLDYQCTGIGEEVIRSAKDYVNTGGGLALATGRAIVSTKSVAHDIGVNTPSILYGGAMLYDFKKEAAQWICPISDDIMGAVEDITHRFPDVSMLVYTDKGIYILSSNELLWTKGIPQECDPANQSHDVTGNILKLNLVGERERVKEIIKTYFLDSGHSVTFASHHFAEIVSAKAGKENAMHVLSDILNIPIERIIAMGDGHNDINMLLHAGVAITLENAKDNVKEVADIILPHCNKQGAAEGFMYAAKILKS